MIIRFSPRTGLAVLSTLALLAFSPAVGAFAEGPSFTSCATKQGQDRGQCIAQLAQDAQNDQANTDGAQAVANSARDIVEACQDKAESGEGIGDCVSAAVQALHDTGDEHAADVAAKGQDLVNSCQDKDGRAFGECVSAKAQELGAATGGSAAGQATAATNANADHTASAPGQRGSEGHPGNQAGRAGR